MSCIEHWRAIVKNKVIFLIFDALMIYGVVRFSRSLYNFYVLMLANLKTYFRLKNGDICKRPYC